MSDIKELNFELFNKREKSRAKKKKPLFCIPKPELNWKQMHSNCDQSVTKVELSMLDPLSNKKSSKNLGKKTSKNLVEKKLVKKTSKKN